MSSDDARPTNKQWNYHPDLPLRDPSIFSWPPRPSSLASWFARNWLTLSERVLMVIVAIGLWAVAYPPLDAARSFEMGWIAQVWIVNLILMLVCAGGLHWWFYTRKAQGKRLKFDHRGQATGKLWTFSNQVHDNMFWSLSSGVGQLSAFQAVIMWAMANGYAPVVTFAESPVWFILALVLLPIWSAFHFYWVHRFLHVPFLYRHVHSLHHRNVNVGPWAGISMHPVEHLLYFSTLLIHLVVPSHPIHLFFHVVYQGPGAAMTHTGYEDLLIKDQRRLALGTFYHQLHHRFYEGNYGNREMPWDRGFGTFHDGTEAATEETRARKKRMFG